MSQENVEVVRRGWEVFMAGVDAGNFAAVFDQGLFAQTFTLTPAPEGLVPGSFVGRDGFVEFCRTWTEDFADWRMWPVEIIDAGTDRVVSVVRQSAKGKVSGAAVELQFGMVFTVKSGQVIEQRIYIDSAQALEAVGLSEQDAHGD